MSIPCKIDPLGVGRFPVGYTRLSYLESLGSVWQIINTELKVNYSWRFELTAQYVGRTNNSFQALCGASNTVNSSRLLFWVTGGKLYFVKDGGGYLIQDAEINEKILYSYQNGKVAAGDKALTIPKLQDNDTLPTFGLFGAIRESLQYTWSQTRIWSARIWDNTGRLVVNFIPALDSSGIPCMFDLVTKKPFRNSGTGAFIAGLSLKQVRDMKLPSQGNVNTLQLSIPCEVYNDAKAWDVIQKAEEKGWTFTFHWTDVDAYFTPKIDAIVGADNYTISYDYTAQKLSLAFKLDVSASQIAEVESLLDRELPKDIVLEIDEMPINYRRLEYIENTGNAIIDSQLYLNSEYEIFADIDYTNPNSGQNCLICTSLNLSTPQYNIILVNKNDIRFDYNKLPYQSYVGTQEGAGKKWRISTNKNVLELQIPELNKTTKLVAAEETFSVDRTAYIFAGTILGGFKLNAKLFALRGSVNGEPKFDFIPAFDTESQGPCLFDKVRRQIFRAFDPTKEDGIGDFNYPGKEEEPTTYSLRRPTMYIQCTEYGIRRLYRTPEDYNGTIEEYAMEHGFKPLIKTPKPEEGYGIPEWRETEDGIIQEWTETDPPIDISSEEI